MLLIYKIMNNKYIYIPFKALCVVALMVFVLPSILRGQAVNNQIKDVVMPSPNAASLGKYGDIPVSLYTGIPNIGIPIHTVQDGMLSLPISLSYHAGGVKVGEPCSWVGLNWSLQAGGMISRTVQGKADERIDGYLEIGSKISTINTPVTLNPNNKCISYNNSTDALVNGQFGANITNGGKDGEPDIFSFSVGGYNGKFYIDADMTNDGEINGNVVLIPKQDLKVKYVLNGNSANIKRLLNFTITTPDGTIYEFGDIGDGNTNDGIEITKPFKQQVDQYVSGWYLRRISTPDNKSKITLNYSRERSIIGYRASHGGSEGNYVLTPRNKYIESLNEINGFRLDNISNSTSTDVVTFTKGGFREDLRHPDGVIDAEKAVKLDFIKIESGSYCKKFTLNQNYFKDDTEQNSEQTSTDYRLRLNSVTESDCAGILGNTLPPYEFIYNTEATKPDFFPNRLSSAIDHWGYYNGVVNNPTSGINIPSTSVDYFNIVNERVQQLRGLSNRETNEEMMRLGSIKQIKYPTGGTTTFEYEANTYFETGAKKSMEYINGTGYNWPNGHYSADPVNRLKKVEFTQTFTDISSVFFVWDYKKALNGQLGASDPINNPSSVTLEVFQGNSIQPVDFETTGCGNDPTKASGVADKLLNLFPGLQNGIQYRFVLSMANAASKIELRRENSTPLNTNVKVGGLRIIKITNFDGINANNNVVKTYDYNKYPNYSSGYLFSKPTYAYKFDEIIGACNPDINTNGQRFKNHFFSENSIVPLSSFEGYHIGYEQVTESMNGLLTKYTYDIDKTPIDIDKLPIVPTLPRVGSGELAEKAQLNNTTLLPEKQIFTRNNDPYEYSAGTAIKSQSYLFGNPGNNSGTSGPATVTTTYTFDFASYAGVTIYYNVYSVTDVGFNSTPPSSNPNPVLTVTFWKDYKIRTRPYRLSKVETVSDVSENLVSITQYTYDALNRFLAPVETRIINSDGKEYLTKSYYSRNMPSGHPNTTIASTFENLYMIGIPLQQESWVGGSRKSGSVLEFKDFGSGLGFTNFYPHKSHSINKDGTLDLNTTIEAYDRGLPSQMKSAGFNISQNYLWDNLKRLTSKKVIVPIPNSNPTVNSMLESTIEYYGTSNLVKAVTNENGVRQNFDYDALMRLKETQSKLDALGSNPKAKMTYTYNYGGGVNNYVQTATTFMETTPITLTAQQYIDGLGRPTYSKKLATGSNGENQNSLVTYDALGRQERAYQIFTGGTMDLNAPKSQYPYITTKYEASPLSRPIEMVNEDDSKVISAYGANTTDDAVKCFKTDATGQAVLSGDVAKGKITNAMNYTFDALQGSEMEVAANAEWVTNAAEATSWIVLDLQATVNISQLKLSNLLSVATASHQLFVSNDPNNFINPINFSGAAYTYTASLVGRYVKIVSNTGNSTKAAWGKVEIFTSTEGYAVNQLFKTTLTNENGNQTLVFKDKLGRVVLTRKIAEANKRIDTYNVYDDYGQLVMVIPPAACDANGTITDNLVFKYKYDNQNRLACKKIPGADWQNFYYDDRDLLTLTQDGNLRSKGKFIATCYDDLGRVKQTACINAATVGANQAAIEAYAKTAFTFAAADVLTETTYKPNKSLVEQTKVRVLGYKKGMDAEFVTTTYTYDQWARPTGTTANSHINKNLVQVMSLNMFDAPTSMSKSWIGSDDQSRGTFMGMLYDNGLRPKETSHSLVIGGNSLSTPRILSNLTYNFKDQVIERNIGKRGNNPYLQSVDYQYNIRNWLTHINSGNLTPTTGKNYPLFRMDENSSIATQYNGVYATPTNQVEDANPDLFTQVLRYDNPVAAIGSTTPQFNGNIAQIQWQVAGREAQAYTYTYDKLDRLTNAEYTDIHEGSWWSNAYDKNNRYQESLSYDDRGNIMTLNRRGQTQKGFVATNTALMGGNHGTIDNLTYTYNDKNQVTKIMDAATLTEGFKSKNNANTGQYSYDANGNMTSDINKEITNIEYNYLNLPVVISFTNSRKIEFTYDATGKKWRKVVTNGSSISVRDYIDGAEYESVNNAASEPKIIHHTEGYIEYDATQLNTTWKGWVYHYTLKDHLGNTRVTFSDANDDGYVNTSTDVKQVNHYYPFGLNMEGNWNGGMGSFKYQFNGIEYNNDFEMNVNTAFFRNLDPATGRWWQIDPKPNMSESMYSAMGNNPIRMADPLGDTTRVFTLQGVLNNTINDQMPNQDHFVTDALIQAGEMMNRGSDWYRMNSSYYIGSNTRSSMEAIINSANKTGGKEVEFLLSYTKGDKELKVHSLGVASNATTNETGDFSDAKANVMASNGDRIFVASGHTHTIAGAKNRNFSLGDISRIHKPTSTVGELGAPLMTFYNVSSLGQLRDYVPLYGQNKTHPALIISHHGYNIYPTAHYNAEFSRTFGHITEDSHGRIEADRNVYDFNGKKIN
jgi:RHS repeat-associated protein